MKSLLLNMALIFILSISSLSFASNESRDFFKWESSEISFPADNQSSPILSGFFSGVSNEALIIVGGIENGYASGAAATTYSDKISILDNYRSSSAKWYKESNLLTPLANGISIHSDNGLICLGGCNSDGVSNKVFLLSWDSINHKVIKQGLPSLPVGCYLSAAAILDNKIYLAGGLTGDDASSASNNFWMLDLDGLNMQWELLTPLPGPARFGHMLAIQYNGDEYCVYLIGGKSLEPQTNSVVYLNDVYEYSIYQKQWKKKACIPIELSSSVAVALGQSYIWIPGGTEKKLNLDAGKGFDNTIWAYHTITNTWVTMGRIPEAKSINTCFCTDDGYLFIPERLSIHANYLLRGNLINKKAAFGAINYTILIVYLAILILTGLCFSKKNKSTEDFFRGGQKVPWFATGLSLFATMLSSITFIAVPSKVFSSDWVLFMGNMAVIAVAPLVIIYIMPFFRRTNVTSAYEYLEKRFNIYARLFGGLSFVLFQIGRMAIVMFIPALTLSTITSMNVIQCILIMGILSIIYSTVGGIEAVIWTDAIQTFVLLGGAILCLVLVMTNLDNGFHDFLRISMQDHKLTIARWDWSLFSYKGLAFWVVIVGSIGQAIIPYSSDQSMIQRYVSVSSQRQAGKSIITNVIMTVFATALFFTLGTALYVFYKLHPQQLSPNFPNDAILPLFISTELPVGIVGIVVAGIFAAAQSTISTSMNSISSVIVTDFVRRFHSPMSEKTYLNIAKFCTFLFGIFGTLLAVLLAISDIKSIWESFMAVLGLLGGAMAGLFLLGIFTKRVQSLAGLLGALTGVTVLFCIKTYTEINFFLYGTIGVFSTIVSGYMYSFFFKPKDNNLSGLTIHTLQ